MGNKELRVNALELNRIGVTCPACKSEMVFDCTGERSPVGGYDCPGCGAIMQDAMNLARSYREFFQRASHLKDKVAISLLVKLDA